MNDESKHIAKKIILMASWALIGGYFVIASGCATCAIMSFVCGFMVARNMADIVTHALYKMKHDESINELKKMLLDARKNRLNEDPAENNEKWAGYIQGIEGAIYRLQMKNV